MNITELSVFFPCINEEGNVESIIKNAEKVLKGLKIKYEIIIVDDGSTDSTGQIADKIAKENSNVRVIHHPKNLGYGEALKSGFYGAKYKYIVYTDGDGQFDFSEVTKFLEKMESSDLVIGYRIKRQDPLFRILFKKGWSLSLFTFFGLTLKDIDCGFKMIKKEVLEKIPHLESQRGAMINAEIVIKAKKAGFRISQIGVNHYPRLSGKPTGASFNVILKSYMDLTKLWWKLKDQRSFFIVLLMILILAAVLRFYKIDQYMTFLGDEGRDAIIIKRMVDEHHFPLIGPPTSVGNIYLGPLYYYMMLVPMFLFSLNPVSASVMNAIVGVLTVALVYYLSKIWFGRIAGLIASFFYAISPVTITYSRFSWNPNPAPFFALLTIISLIKAKSGRAFWFVLMGFSLAAAVQMHYLALILIPIVAFLFPKKYKWGAVYTVITFLIVMSPLLWFDLRHDFLNYKAVTALFSKSQEVKVDLISSLVRIPQIYSNILVGRYLTAQNLFITPLVSLLLLFPFVYSFLKKRKLDQPLLILFVWLSVGLLGLSFYQNQIYDHYLGFLNPVPLLLLGALMVLELPKNNLRKIYRFTICLLLIYLVVLNFSKNPLVYPPNNQLLRTQKISKFIIEKSGGGDFNFALIAKSNYDSAYQFYLDLYGHKPKVVPANKTAQLFVVCEDEVCDPTHNAKYEVAGFGWSKIEWMENYEGVKIYKLVENPSGKP